jgi:outer membrane lipoprotein carrier protein
MWVYLPENSQVIESDIEQINKTDQNDPMAFLTGLGNLSRDFAIDWAVPNQDVDGNYVLEMIPHRTSSLINKLIIVVDRYAVESYQNRGKGEPFGDPAIAPPSRENYASGKNTALPGDDQGSNALWFPILSTAVYDPNGNSTIIEFSNLRINDGIPDTTFDFAIPSGVQVVRPTGKEMGF